MINIIVATRSEADPVINTLKLKKVSATLDLYQNKELQLVVSGIGKCNTATACGWLAQKTFNDSAHTDTSVAWLNFGIAGHQSAELGTAFTAHKVTDLANGRVWFPHRVNTDLASSDITTVDKPLEHYLQDQLHDMEASAFMEASRRFSDAELVHAIKVVSDNSTQPLSNVCAKLASQLITNNIEPITNTIDTLQSLSNTIERTDKKAVEAIQQQWHFTRTQKVQLERLIQRYDLLFDPITEIPEPLLRVKSSKEVINWFQNTVNNAEFTL